MYHRCSYSAILFLSMIDAADKTGRRIVLTGFDAENIVRTAIHRLFQRNFDCRYVRLKTPRVDCSRDRSRVNLSRISKMSIGSMLCRNRDGDLFILLHLLQRSLHKSGKYDYWQEVVKLITQSHMYQAQCAWFAVDTTLQIKHSSHPRGIPRVDAHAKAAKVGIEGAIKTNP